MLISALLTLVIVVSGFIGWKILMKKLVKRNKLALFQFGKFTNTRPGLKQSAYHEDEVDVVPFTDYKYWIRLYPNMGFQLPLLGYYSQFRGRRR